jgi:copper(I)-binding protein
VTASCPSRRRAARRTARLVAALVTGAAVLWAGSACSAGKVTQTAAVVAAVPGVNANASPNALIALRDLVIAYGGPQGYPVGASVPLVVRIFNQGDAAVRLVRVSAGDAAERVVLVSDVRETATTAAPPPSPSGSASASASASAGSPASPPAPTPEVSPTPRRPSAEQESFTVVVPSLGFALLVPGQGPYLQLVGLTRPLIPGQTVTVTFGFDDGSTVSAAIPFSPPATPLPRPSVIESR